DLRELPRELRAPRAVVPPRELVDDHVADVVAIVRVLAPGIAEPHDEEIERGALPPRPEPHALALGRSVAGSVCPRLGAGLGAFLGFAFGALFGLALDALDLFGLLLAHRRG